MADNARPQTNVPLPSGLIAAFGDASAAVKAARREVKELTREINSAVRRGETVGPQVAKRLDQAQMLEKSLTESIKRQKLLRQGIEATASDAKALKFLIGAQALRQFMQTGIPDPRSLAAMVFSSGETLAALASRHLGEKSSITRGARAFGRVAPFVGEAIASIGEAVDQVRADNLKLKAFAADVAQGKYGIQEWNLYQVVREENRRIFGNDPKAEFETIYDLAQQLASADTKAWDRAISPAIERQIRRNEDGLWKDVFARWQDKWALRRMRGGNLDEMFEKAIEKQREQMGFAEAGLQLSEEQERIVKSRALYALIHDMTSKQREDLLEEIKVELKSLGKVYDEKFKNVSQLQLEASTKFRETEERRMNEIAFQRARHRVALNGRIGE